MAQKRSLAQSQSHIKHHNLTVVLSAIRAAKKISRTQLSKETGMSPATMTRTVGLLSYIGLLDGVSEKEAGTVGRTPTQLSLNPDAFYTLAVSIDADLICVGILDFNRRFVQKRQFPHTLKFAGHMAVMNQVKATYDSMLNELGIPLEKVAGMGLCCVGAVSRELSTVLFSQPLMWSNIELEPICQALFGLPVVAENDVKSALIAECETVHRGVNHIVYFKVEKGMEAAAICDGHLLRGHTNAAGAVGHITADPDGEPCECGRNGCLQVAVNEKLILKKARRHVAEITKIDEVMMAYELEMDWAKDIVDDISKKAAIALNSLVCQYNPDVLVMGGMFFDRYPFLLDAVLGLEKPLFYKPMTKDIVITRAAAGVYGALLGAGILAQERHLAELIDQQN